MTEPKTLPSFEFPPVHEVAIGMQFRGCEGLTTVQLGRFWETVRSAFPRVDDLPPFASLPIRTLPELELIALPPLRRVRMSNEDSSVSIHLQSNRLIVNWVKSSDTVVYPRFGAIYAVFQDSLERIASYFAAESVGEIDPTHYELTYVNELGAFGEGVMPRLEGLLEFCKWSHVERSFLPQPQTVSFAWQFSMPNDVGTLVLNVNPAKRSDGTETVIFVLKCAVDAKDAKSPMSGWFESAHEAIVRSFTELTTPDAHKQWGRNA